MLWFDDRHNGETNVRHERKSCYLNVSTKIPDID